MKKLLLFALSTSILVLAGYLLYPSLQRQIFNISGTITMPEELKNKYTKPNFMLFIVVKNENDMPIAINKIINPTFPLNYTINAENLVMPDLLCNKLRVEAHLNIHGKLGKPLPGDAKGKFNGTVFIRNHKVDINIDTTQ
jgi:hypothetical protein